MEFKNKLLLIVALLFLFSCEQKQGKEKTDINPYAADLIGDWELHQDESNATGYFEKAFGIGFTTDSIEFFNGFFISELDSSTMKKRSKYLGSTTAYKMHDDSLFFKSLLDGRWKFQWKVKEFYKDSIFLVAKDSSVLKFHRLSYNIDTIPDFDQVIYSSSGCYGSCPIVNVSVDKTGKYFFLGEGYVNKLGFFKGRLDPADTRWLFTKFKKANPIRLKDAYSVGNSDDEEITTTFIKNGKIIKSINDYGKDGPPELVWAYTAIGNSYASAKLDSLPCDEPFYPKVGYYTFKKQHKILPLFRSESFYLWTELKNAQIKDTLFKKKYKLTANNSFFYWGPDPNRTNKHKYTLRAIFTDGRFYRFEYNEGLAITYDIGYNFFERNFNDKDFRVQKEWEIDD